MPRLARLLAVAFVPSLGAVSPPSAAQRAAPSAPGDQTSAPIANVAYDVTFDQALARRRTVRVAMSFTTSSDAPVVLSLPAWTPGAYEISYYSRAVLGFDATGDGRPVAWDKLDYDTWRIRPAGAKRVTVAFDYLADSLDNAMAWARPDFALLNGTNLFLYPEGRGFDFPATVRIHTDSAWRIATGMSPGTSPRTYAAPNYHELVDMPFFVGKFDLDSARVASRWLRLAAYPSGSIPAAVKARDFAQLGKIIEAQGAVFGEVPFQNYMILQIADSSFAGISGLEHQNSHVDVTNPIAIGQPVLTTIYAHEIFHAWNVKRMRPADLWPYDYAREQPTPWLWVSEGVTDYYADLSQVRSGVIDSAAFFGLTAEKMAEVANTRPVALEDASLSTWVHPEDGTEYIYYPKGSLAGFMLDVLIRDASDNRKSLDDVMRQVYQESYKRGKGFTSDQWWSAVSAAAGGKSFADFYAKYVDGREPYPWDTILPLAGLRLTLDTLRMPTLGVSTAADSEGIRVESVVPGSSADLAGVRAGDYLLSIADVPLTERGFVARIREKLGARAGVPVAFKLHRDGDTLTVSAPLQVQERISMHLDADPSAPPKAARVRAGILHGR